MLKTISRLFLGAGTLTESVREALEVEGIDVLAEGIRGTVTFRNYRAPGRRSVWRRTLFAGVLALTSRRIIAFSSHERLLDIPYDHPAARDVQFAVEKVGCLRITYEASTFHRDRSGMVDLRFFMPQASMASALIEQRIT